MVNANFQLHRPNRETARALIRNTLDGVLTKAPILSKQIVNELVNLIVAQRAYEVNSRAIQASDQMLSTATNIVR